MDPVFALFRGDVTGMLFFDRLGRGSLRFLDGMDRSGMDDRHGCMALPGRCPEEEKPGLLKSVNISRFFYLFVTLLPGKVFCRVL